MTKPNPIVVVGAVFFFGLATLLVWSYSIAHSNTPFDTEGFGSWVLVIIIALIPAGATMPLLNFTSGQPSIAVAIVSILQLGVLLGLVSLVHALLRRFSPALACFGTMIIYMLTCYGTNLLWLPAFSIARKFDLTAILK